MVCDSGRLEDSLMIKKNEWCLNNVRVGVHLKTHVICYANLIGSRRGAKKSSRGVEPGGLPVRFGSVVYSLGNRV